MIYSFSIIVSTLLNETLVEVIGVNHKVGWFVTLMVTGFMNYFTVRGSFQPDPQKPANSK